MLVISRAKIATYYVSENLILQHRGRNERVNNERRTKAAREWMKERTNGQMNDGNNERMKE